MYDLIAPDEYLGNKLLLQAVEADKGNDLGLLKAVLKAVGRCINSDVRSPLVCFPTLLLESCEMKRQGTRAHRRIFGSLSRKE